MSRYQPDHSMISDLSHYNFLWCMASLGNKQVITQVHSLLLTLLIFLLLTLILGFASHSHNSKNTILIAIWVIITTCTLTLFEKSNMHVQQSLYLVMHGCCKMEPANFDVIYCCTYYRGSYWHTFLLKQWCSSFTCTYTVARVVNYIISNNIRWHSSVVWLQVYTYQCQCLAV